jgi:hypothetical protein
MEEGRERSNECCVLSSKDRQCCQNTQRLLGERTLGGLPSGVEEEKTKAEARRFCTVAGDMLAWRHVRVPELLCASCPTPAAIDQSRGGGFNIAIAAREA